jgi:large subunit ribosomal protein L30
MVASSRKRAGISGGELKLTQVRSGIGTKPKHRGTLRALGLGRIGSTNLLPDRPEIRGMIARVPQLVAVERVTDPAPEEPVIEAGEGTDESEVSS